MGGGHTTPTSGTPVRSGSVWGSHHSYLRDTCKEWGSGGGHTTPTSGTPVRSGSVWGSHHSYLRDTCKEWASVGDTPLLPQGHL